MKRLLTLILALALILSALLPSALADTSVLRGWDKSAGYVYATLGEYRYEEDGLTVTRQTEGADGVSDGASDGSAGVAGGDPAPAETRSPQS